MESNRDQDRLKEFNELNGNIVQTIERVKKARTAVNEAKQSAPVEIQVRLETLAGELSRLNQELNQKKPQTIMKAAGAKHEIKTSDQNQYEHRPNNQ